MLAFAAWALISGIQYEVGPEGSKLCNPLSHSAILISMGYLFYSLQIGRSALLVDVWWESECEMVQMRRVQEISWGRSHI